MVGPAPELRCGEALCKKTVTFAEGATKPWPVQCASCGCHLYPGDILQGTLQGRELEPHRAELMQLSAGRLLACSSDEVRGWWRAAPEAEDEGEDHESAPEPTGRDTPDMAPLDAPSGAEVRASADDVAALMFEAGKSKAEVWQWLASSGVEASEAQQVVVRVASRYHFNENGVATPPPPPPFPFFLASLQDAEQLQEKFGYLPILGAGTLLGVAGFVLSSESTRQTGIAVGMVLAALVLVGYEVLRRKYRMVLAIRGDRIGVYKKGELSQTIGFEQISYYELRAMNTLRWIMMPVILACASIAQLTGSLSTSSIVGHPALGLFLGIFGTISLVKTRILGHHFIVHYSHKAEQIMLGEADYRRLTGHA